MPGTKVFRGEGDLMVDALVSASQQAKIGSDKPMPGFGRDLVPYFDPDSDWESSLNKQQQQPAKEGKKSSKKKAKAQHNPEPAPAPGQKLYPCGPAGLTPVIQQPQTKLAVQQPAAQPKKQQEKAPKPAKQPAQQPQKAAAQPQKAAPQQPQSTLGTRWAGPGFSNSPAPDSLPLPSFMAAPAATDSGSELMKMLQAGQTKPLAAPQPAPPQAPAPGGVDVLQLLHNAGQSQPVPAAPAPAPAPAPMARSPPKAPLPLLTPGKLAALVSQNPGPIKAPLPAAPAPAGEDTVQKLRSMLSGNLTATFATDLPPAPSTPGGADSSNGHFQMLLTKLETTAH